MRNIFIILFILAALSCTRNVSVETPATITWLGAYPMAILQPGEQPLWFQVTENGPVHIELIDDAAFTCALIPWPYAPHISFMAEDSGAIVMVVNRDGFLKLTPNNDYSGAEKSSLALYRFSGGDFWRQYTVGGFIYFEDTPTALIYLDERFLASNTPLPRFKTWAFDMNSNNPFVVDIPAIRFFSVEDGWDIDAIRLADDDYYYFRAAKRSGFSPAVRMFRTKDLFLAGEEISVETFFNSAPRDVIYSHPSLPPLPENFVYTGLGYAGESLFATWEEQEDFSIGAAGFVVVKP